MSSLLWSWCSGSRRKHAASRSAPTSNSSGGTSAGQRSNAYGQRGWKRQPLGGRAGSGTSPGQRLGQVARAVGVAGSLRSAPRCTDAAASARPRASAPTRRSMPRYMTQTASATWRTIARSCEISSRPSSPVAREPHEQVRDLRLRRGVERRERLVEHDHRRVGGERAGDRDALALPAAELVRVAAVRGGRQADLLEQRCRTRSRAPALVDAGEREAVGDLRADRAARVQRRVRVLEDHLQPARSREPGAAPQRRAAACPRTAPRPPAGGVEPDGRAGERATCRSPTRRRARRSGPRSTSTLAPATARTGGPPRAR